MYTDYGKTVKFPLRTSVSEGRFVKQSLFVPRATYLTQINSVTI